MKRTIAILALAAGSAFAQQPEPPKPTLTDFQVAFKVCGEQVESADKNVRALQVSQAVQIAQKDMQIEALRKQVAELTPKPKDK
jgi:hypothetical protein